MRGQDAKEHGRGEGGEGGRQVHVEHPRPGSLLKSVVIVESDAGTRVLVFTCPTEQRPVVSEGGKPDFCFSSCIKIVGVEGATVFRTRGSVGRFCGSRMLSACLCAAAGVHR